MYRELAILGPESTGKSTAAYQLAKQIGAQIVEEQCREYLKNIGKNYTHEDILAIAKLQIEAEMKALSNKNSHIIFDTELITLEIWLDYYGMIVPNWISDHIKYCKYEYFLFDTNIEWVEDGLRDNPNDRKELLGMFQDRLKFYQKGFEVVTNIDLFISNTVQDS